MKRFFLGIGIFTLSLLLPFAAFFLYVQAIPAQFTATLVGTLHAKYELLQKPGDSPRILLVGGSSSPYGIDCELLTELTGYDCICVGSVHGVGLEMYANLLEGNIREGDIVLFAPEYGMWNNRINPSVVWYSCENDPALLARMPLHYFFRSFAGGYFDYAAAKLNQSRITPQGSEGIYPDMGPRGDIVTYRETLLEHGYIANDPITIAPDQVSEDAVRILNRLHRRCAESGALLLITFAPANRAAVVSEESERAAFAALLEEELDAPLIGEIETAIQDGSLFYDSNYHLTTEGALQRTRTVSEWLTPYL